MIQKIHLILNTAINYIVSAKIFDAPHTNSWLVQTHISFHGMIKFLFCLLCLLIHVFLNEKGLDKLPKTYYKHTVYLNNLVWTIFFSIFLILRTWFYVCIWCICIYTYMIIYMRLLMRNFTLDDPQVFQWYQYKMSYTLPNQRYWILKSLH